MITTMQLVSPIEVLLHAIIKQFLSDSYCMSVVSEKPINFNFQQSFINIDARNIHECDLVDKLLQASELGCSDYIVRMENPQIFVTAFGKANHLGIVRRGDKKIIFLPFPCAEYNTKALEILSMSECSTVANVLLILSDIDAEYESYNLVTHQFVGSDSEINQPLFLDRWESTTQSFDHNANLFPHDMLNMQGKTIKVSCFTYKPYVLLDLDPTMTHRSRDGIDIRIIDEFCRQINCSIAIIRQDKDLWGHWHKNESGIGIISSVAENKADIGITGLSAWTDRWHAMDMSTPYINEVATCIVPAPRILASWDMPLLPFSKMSWLAIIVTFCFGVIGLYIAKQKSLDKVLLIVFGSMITQPQYNISNKWRDRIIIGWLLATGIILVCAYGAGLSSTFSVPKYEDSIDTLKDIIDRDIKWGAIHDAWIYPLNISLEPEAKKIIKQFRVYSFDELKKRSLTRSMAFAIEIFSAGTLGIPEFITEETAVNMQLLLENFYYDQVVIMMSKNSPYTEKLNQLIGRLHQSGLLLAWENQVTLKYMNAKVQNVIKLSRTKNEMIHSQPLNIKQIQGVYLLYVVGVTTAFILVLGEIFIFYCKYVLN